MALKYGKLPARPGAASFKFSTYFNAEALPKPPDGPFGHSGLIRKVGTAWGMLGNDQYGCCVLAGAGHETKQWNAERGIAVPIDAANTLSDYSAITGFNPLNPLSDQGTDMVVAADYRKKTGIVDAEGKRHVIDAYLALKVGDLDELYLATWLLGAVGVGITVPASCEAQFRAGTIWTNVPGDPIVGGHYIVCVDRNSKGLPVFVTWGGDQASDEAWYKQNNDEVLGYVSLEALDAKGLSPEQFNRAQLIADLSALPSAA